MATKTKTETAQTETRLSRAQAALSTAQTKLTDREARLAEAKTRATNAKARQEELRPEASEGIASAIAALREQRQAAADADDDVRTAQVGVERAELAVENAQVERSAAQREDTAQRFEASKADRIASATYVDRALAGLVLAVQNYAATVKASQQLYQSLSGRQETSASPRIEGVIATALHDFVSLPFPHAGYRRPLAVIEAELLGLGEPDAKRVEEERQADAAEQARLTDPARIERERAIEVERLKHFVMRSAGSKAPECIEARRRLAELTFADAPDAFDRVQVREVYD